jgi:hypothetical protein
MSKCHFCDQEASSNKEQVGTCDACWEKYRPRPGTPPKNWKKGCQASASKTFGDWSMDRCGKEPTRPTTFGPMCDECWAHLRETTRKGENLLGMMQGYPKKAKDES